MEALDPERIIDPTRKVTDFDAVQRYDGYVVQSTGDGIFAPSGAPLAHEDHPVRALYAALRMQEEMRGRQLVAIARGRRPSDRGACRSEYRRSSSTGTIATRQCKTEHTPIGHTANLASRMQALAPTGLIAGERQYAPSGRRIFRAKAAGADNLGS